MHALSVRRVGNMKLLKTKSFHQEKRQWYAIDASGMRLGRLATQVAILLQGKHKAQYTPHADLGDFVVIYNCANIACTSTDKIYYRHSGRMGSLKTRTIEEQMTLDPCKVMMKAVQNMLKRSPLGRDMLKKCRCFSGMHTHQAQQPRLLKIDGSKHITEVVYGTDE